MRERVRQLNGKLQIQSGDTGVGITVTLAAQS
jgi:signal transduction histidine kinase